MKISSAVEPLDDVFMLYLPLFLEMELTVVLSRVVVLDAFNMPSNICQFPP